MILRINQGFYLCQKRNEHPLARNAVPGQTFRVHWGGSRTSAATIARFGEFAAHGDPAVAARAWTAAGFDDEETAQWLTARCFDPGAARALADLGVSPVQASKRTRDGRGDYLDTIAFKVARGDLSPRQGAARAGSSR
jgi:hypothetical protein